MMVYIILATRNTHSSSTDKNTYTNTHSDTGQPRGKALRKAAKLMLQSLASSYKADFVASEMQLATITRLSSE